MNTSGTTKYTPKGGHDTSIYVYNTCLGAYDRSRGQVNAPVKVKSPKGAYDTSIDVYNTCLGAYDPSGGQANTSGKAQYTPKGAC